MLRSEEILTAFENLQKRPVDWAVDFLGISLWQRQVDILKALVDYDKVAVKSGHALGKDYIAAVATLWFLYSYPPAIVVTTAPTERQVNEIVWGEIRSLFNNSKVRLPGKLLESQLMVDDKYYAIGFTTKESQQMTGKFQGFHAPNILVIVSEAQAVENAIYEQIEGILTSENSKLLLIGNPLQTNGKFFEAFSNPIFKKITMSCLESPNFITGKEVLPGLCSRKWVEEKRNEWGERSNLWISRILGEFPQEGTDTLIGLKHIEASVNRPIEVWEEEEVILGGDVARYGDAMNVIFLRKGEKFKKCFTRSKVSTMETTGLIKVVSEEEEATIRVIDDDGVGGGVVDRLREQGLAVVSFHGGAKFAPVGDVHFKNLRSQFYWYCKKRFEAGEYSIQVGEDGISERDFEILKSQLSSIKYKTESDGKIKVESKDDMLARGLKSPDYADAFMMTEYGRFFGSSSGIEPVKWR